jgi:glutamate 5-kinase
MYTKIVAARLATSAGVMTVITRSSKPGNIANIVRYLQGQKLSQHGTPQQGGTPPTTEQGTVSRSASSARLSTVSLKPPLHTRFLPDPEPMRDRYFWLLYGLAPRGIVYIDEGAHHALADKAGLLPVGVVHVEGHFAQQEAVRIIVVKRLPPNHPSGEAYEKVRPAPMEVGRAVVNYSAIEIARIKGARSTEIPNILGYADSEYVALRENIAFMKKEKNSRPVTPSLGLGAENGNGVVAEAV